MITEGYVECTECGVIKEVMLAETVEAGDTVGGTCECGCMNCLVVIEE